MMEDLLGDILRVTPRFRGKWRLQRFWERRLRRDCRLAKLPEGSLVEVDMGIPYERMVWLEAEEWDELQYLRGKLKTGQVFVDVGANIGLWTFVAASTVGPTGRIFSFEPNPETFRKLTANIARNSYENVMAFPYAVSSRNGFVRFVCEENHNISAITDESGRPGSIEVPTTSLDSVLMDRLAGAPIAGIKLDTEGHELPALEGALALIKAS